MVACGKKTIETRTWPTTHRGPLLIVSTRRPPIAPAGCAVAVANLVDCRPMTKDDEVRACTDYYDRAWAWVLEDIRAIEPFPVLGRLGLYDVEVEPAQLPAGAFDVEVEPAQLPAGAFDVEVEPVQLPAGAFDVEVEPGQLPAGAADQAEGRCEPADPAAPMDWSDR
jgi:hypothetical protein